MESYTITREPHPAGHSITLLLNGRFNEDALPELEQSIAEAHGARQRVVIDLSEVTLVDRKIVQYFSEQAISDVKLINCPVYLLRWITQVSNEY
jgi:anti-anti-sigma regulatory factor